MLFSNVIGLEKNKVHLIETYKADRTAHAQIFLSKPGNGGLALALGYTQYLLCEDQQEQDACGVCNACKKVQKLIHPDLHFAYPTVGSKKVSNDFLPQWRSAVIENPYLNVNEWLTQIGAENQQGNITKQECVEIVKKLTFKSVEGRFKVLILWLPEFLGKEGNRLLKLIEEPAPDTVFILVAERAEQILNTILSRCQLVRLDHLTDEEITQALEERQQINTAKATSITHLAEGNYNKALQLTEEMSNSNSKIFLDWIRVCFKGQPADLVQWVEAVINGKHPSKDFFVKMGRKDQITLMQYGLFFFKELLSLKIHASDDRVRLRGSELETAKKIESLVGFEQLETLVTLFDEVSYHIERNGNPRILLLNTSIKMHRTLQNQRIL